MSAYDDLAKYIADLEAKLAAAERKLSLDAAKIDSHITATISAEKRAAIAERRSKVLHKAIEVAREQHPYPPDIFQATVEEFVRLVPDPQARAAITGIIGRIGYDVCLSRIDLHIAEAEEEVKTE